MDRFPTWVEIDLDLLDANLDAIREEVGPDVRILLTVKADAYGHGAIQIAQAVEQRVAQFGVATIDEALELKRSGVGRTILIMSPMLEEEIPVVVDEGFACTISSLEFAKRLSECAVARSAVARVHVEIDTGMGRTGFLPSDVAPLLEELAGLSGIRLDGLFTHFTAVDATYTRKQLGVFNTVVERLSAAGVDAPLVHAANSAALAGVPESHLLMVRPGLLAYGYLADGTSPLVAPIMSWKTRIVQIRAVPAKTPISYERTFVTKRPTLVGVLPVGYGHGVPFRLSNTGEVIIAGERAPIIGRVTMDMTMVDLTGLPIAPAAGDVVTLIGRDGDAELGAADIARRADTITYDVLCGINKRVPRVYLRGGRVETIKSLLGTRLNSIET